MPELPEVEIIRRGLQRFLTTKKISSVDVPDRRALTGFDSHGRPRRRQDLRRFSQCLVGETVRQVIRRGKYLGFCLSSGQTLLCHLRMTGQLIYGPPRESARIRLFFRNGSCLNFCDTRRFGEMWLVPDWKKDNSVQALGPEPLSKGWNVKLWIKALRGSSAKIQTALLDQRRLAGLGNIYAMEALYRAGIRPFRRCSSIRPGTYWSLARNIRQVLRKGLKGRGVSFSTYRDATGARGRAQESLLVYDRDGKPCRRCGTTLSKIKINGRGAVYCRKCQN